MNTGRNNEQKETDNNIIALIDGTWKTKQISEEEPEVESNPVVLAHLNDIENPEYIGKAVTVEVAVSSGSIPYPIPASISAIVKDEDNKDIKEVTKNIKLNDPVNLMLPAISTEQQQQRLKKLYKGKVLALSTTASRILYIMRVRPPIQTLTKQGNKLIDDKNREYKYFDIAIVSDKPLNFQGGERIQVTGIPLPHPKNQQTTLLVYNISFPESTENFNVENLNQLKAKFENKTVSQRWNWILDNTEFYTRIIGRRNVSALTYLISFTPLYTNFDGKNVHGWGLGDVIGDTTTGKSDNITNILTGILKAGMFISAESASIAGIKGAAVQMDGGKWLIEWGFLPLMNQKLLAMDGCHKISPSAWAEIAEAERTGELDISKAAKGKVPARTRQIKIYNPVDKEAPGYPTIQLSEFLYPVQAYQTIADGTTIARRDMAIFVDCRDVSIEQVDKLQTSHPEKELQYLSDAVRWAWSNKATVKFTDEAVTYILEKATELYNTFNTPKIPLVTIDMKYKIARLSTSAAYLTLSTTDYTDLTVTKEHVELICNFLTDEYTKAGLNMLAQNTKFNKLTVEDVNTLLKEIDTALNQDPIERTKLLGILSYITRAGRTTQVQIKTEFNLTEKSQLRPLMSKLQTLDLVKNNRGSWATTKLIDAYKVTEGFAVFAVLAASKNGIPPTNNELKIQNKTVDDKEKEDSNKQQEGDINSEHGKNGIPGKILIAEQLHPTPGQICREVDSDILCPLEAIWNLNGNLYCNDHFQNAKRSLEQAGRVVCEKVFS